MGAMDAQLEGPVVCLCGNRLEEEELPFSFRKEKTGRVAFVLGYCSRQPSPEEFG